MGLWRNLISAVRGFFAPRAKPILYDGRPFGPAFEPLGNDTIRILEGDLAGQEMKLTTSITSEEAHVFLHQNGKQIGHCDIQREGHEASVVLWNIVVDDRLRHKGLASIMARVGFRRMLEISKTATFAIRMIRLIKPSERVTKIQNVGIGIIARKLGFTPEYDLQELLRQKNIQLIELIQSDGVMPPGYRIVLKVFPLVLIAFLVDPETNKPFPAGHRIYNSLVTPESAEMWARGEMIIIGNGNYLLRKKGLEQMINHLAANPAEAEVMSRRLRPVR